MTIIECTGGKEMKGKGLLGGVLIASLLMAVPFTASAHGGKEHVKVNGVEVKSEANHIIKNTLYVDVAAYTELVDVKYQQDGKGKTVTVNGTKINTHVIKGVATAPVRELAKATGAEQVTWDGNATTVNILDLPAGTIQLTPSVPGMGEHWANPKDMPLGPIYGVQDGKILFIEQMLKQEDLASGKTFTNIPGMKGLPSPAVEHSDIEFQPKGHEGFEMPHYDLHNYFVTHEAHLKIGQNQDEIAAIQQQLSKYENVKQAEKDGYVKITDFVPQMGYHYMNPKALGTDSPNILLYADVDGKLKLVGAEWGTPDPNAKSPIDGTSFKLVHKASAHYSNGSEIEVSDQKQAPETNNGAKLEEWHPDLYGMHIWFIENPNGTFADMNPALGDGPATN